MKVRRVIAGVILLAVTYITTDPFAARIADKVEALRERGSVLEQVQR